MYRTPQRTHRGAGFAALAIAGAFLTITARPVRAAEEGADLLLKYDQTAGQLVVVPQVPGTPDSALFDRTLEAPFAGATPESDTGFDVVPGIDSDPSYTGNVFSQAVVHQVDISNGLTAIYQYDGVSKIFGPSADGYVGNFYLTKDKAVGAGYDQTPPGDYAPGDPNTTYFHQHVLFTATDPGDYFFDFQYTNVKLLTGATLPDSQVFRINYHLGSGAAVPEPGSLALLASTGLPLLALRRKRTA